MIFAIFGPPGSGKGTQASRLAQHAGFVHVSTGEILRDAVKKRTPLGIRAEKFVHSGGLVPDELIIEMVEEKFNHLNSEKGVILDGFPRTVPQAKALDQLLDKMKKKLMGILIDLPEKDCVARLSERKTCPKCGLTYNPVTYPPKKENFCDKCGIQLILREDDRPETVKQRLKVYYQLTEPLINYYEQTHRLLRVDGSLSPELVFKNLINLVKYKV